MADLSLIPGKESLRFRQQPGRNCQPDLARSGSLQRTLAIRCSRLWKMTALITVTHGKGRYHTPSRKSRRLRRPYSGRLRREPTETGTRAHGANATGTNRLPADLRALFARAPRANGKQPKSSPRAIDPSINEGPAASFNATRPTRETAPCETSLGIPSYRQACAALGLRVPLPACGCRIDIGVS